MPVYKKCRSRKKITYTYSRTRRIGYNLDFLCSQSEVLRFIFQDIQDRYRRLESRYNESEDIRATLEHDLHALVTIVSIARRTGRWQLEGVKLRHVDFSRVFGDVTLEM